MSSKCANSHLLETSLDYMFQLFVRLISILGILEQFGTGNYTWRLVIIQNLYEFKQFFLYNSLCQTVLMFPDLNMSQKAKCFNKPRSKYVPGRKNVSIPINCILFELRLLSQFISTSLGIFQLTKVFFTKFLTFKVSLCFCIYLERDKLQFD